MAVFRIKPQRSVVMVVDLQERLLPIIDGGDAVLERSACLIRCAAALGLPIVTTEQNPRKLGATVAAIREALPPDTPVEPKLKFSAMVEAVRERISQLGRPTVILCGIEAHVCVTQTALDLLGAGYVPVVCVDAIGSRRASDKTAALERLRGAGAVIASVEMAVLEMVGEAGTEAFRAVLPLIK